MSGAFVDLGAIGEAQARRELAPVVAQLLRRASAALEADAQVARREIDKALALLAGGEVQVRTKPEARCGPGRPLARWQERRVLEHIQANLEAPVQVEDLARTTRLSTSYFFRAFKRSFGLPPHAYVIALRLGRAREMLLEGDEPVGAIAAACGFADQAHFSRVFRRWAGCAPGVWRREQRSFAGTGRLSHDGATV